MQILFTADLHLGHGNIIRYCNRPFLKNIELDDEGNFKTDEDAILAAELNYKRLIENINRKMKPNDILIHNGDFCCIGNEKGVPGLRMKAKEYEDMINCQIIHVSGNHDLKNGLENKSLDSMTISFGNKNFLIRHKPVYDIKEIWGDRNCPYHAVLCGHVHTAWLAKYSDCNSIININIGVDSSKHYVPFSKSDILNIYDKAIRVGNLPAIH